MRIAFLAAALAIPLTASATPFRDVIHGPAKRLEPGQPRSFTKVSRTLFLNSCMPDGCTVSPGFDDARTNRSTIARAQTQMAAWPHGPQAWNTLVQCVRDMYAPFDIDVTDVDPGTADHFEVMVAGTPGALGLPAGVGGVAPFVACDGQIPNNVMSFVFSAAIDNPDFLCWATAQESAHVWGLDHELHPLDPMTYLTPPIKKEGFQNEWSPCGEEKGKERDCECGGRKQNSYQYLMDTFGPKTLEPATLTITHPKDGAWVKPGVKVRFEMMSQLSVTTASLLVDGAAKASIGKMEALVLATPADLAAGDRMLTVVAKDTADREITGQTAVHVTASCADGASCAKGFGCLGGYCLPGADIAGGLGAPCANNDDCVTGTCGSDGTTSLCTGECDAGNTCPSGYTCMSASGGGGVCWLAPDDGGCSTSSDTSPVLALLGLGALVMLRRRRK
jgi:MYXO-CTERM domain-containing protein